MHWQKRVVFQRSERDAICTALNELWAKNTSERIRVAFHWKSHKCMVYIELQTTLDVLCRAVLVLGTYVDCHSTSPGNLQALLACLLGGTKQATTHNSEALSMHWQKRDLWSPLVCQLHCSE
jgi:hypothetical protein